MVVGTLVGLPPPVTAKRSLLTFKAVMVVGTLVGLPQCLKVLKTALKKMQ